MLVLSRGKNEKVCLTGLGNVMVSEIKSNGQVRLSFDMPDEIGIHRQEVYDSVVADVKSQLPDDCDKDAIVNLLFAEVAFQSAERNLHAASEAAVLSVSDGLAVQYRGRTWEFVSTPTGPIAIEV